MVQAQFHSSNFVFTVIYLTMDAKAIVSSAATFPSTFLSSEILSNRGLLMLPSAAANRKSCRAAGVKHTKFNFSPRAVLTRNLEATGVPTSVPVRVANELLQAGHRYLDVRTPEEFNAGHPAEAVNIPYMYRVGSGMTHNSQFLEQVLSHFRKYDEILVGCQSGKRSTMAATVLLAAGFTSVTDVAGGFAAWARSGLPTQP